VAVIGNFAVLVPGAAIHQPTVFRTFIVEKQDACRGSGMLVFLAVENRAGKVGFVGNHHPRASRQVRENAGGHRFRDDTSHHT
jgi:hypothetical protein